MTGTFLWLIGTAVLSFVVSALFAGGLALRRNIYLLIYIPVSAALIIAYYLWSGTDIAVQLTTNWGWGLLGATAAALIAVKNVRSQKPSQRRKKVRFAVDLLWPGFAYGFIDGMLLSVLPIMMVYRAMSPIEGLQGTFGTLIAAFTAFLVSLLITLVYHVGYPT